MPRNLLAAARREHRTDWITGLPATVEHLADLWSLDVGAPFQPGGQTAWVAPVRDEAGNLRVLKVGWPHPEAEHEAHALATWRGRGTVMLHATARLETATALLLEECVPGVALSSRPQIEQDVVITDLLRRLWVDPADGHPFRPLSDLCAQWADEFDDTAAAHGRLGLDPGLIRLGLALFRQLPASAERHVLLCSDLHAGNVLAAEREPRLVIDPKPYVGDPTYDLLQHMLNCDHRLHTDPLGLSRHLADLAGLDPERVRLWLFARCVQQCSESPALADVACRIAPR